MVQSEITIIGSGGNIGRYLSLLFKTDTVNISKLKVYDVSSFNKGVACDLSYINNKVEIIYYPEEQLYEAMQSDVVIVVAGFPRKEGMTRADLFSKNADIIYNIVSTYSKIIKNLSFTKVPYLCIATNPVNSIMPLVKIICDETNIWNQVSNKIIGLTWLDTSRLRKLTNRYDDEDVFVVGGHSKNTMEIYPKDLPQNIATELKLAGENVINAYQSKSSAALSMAHSTYSFIIKLLYKESCIGMVYVNKRFISTHLTYNSLIGNNIILNYETNKNLLAEAKLALDWWKQKKLIEIENKRKNLVVNKSIKDIQVYIFEKIYEELSKTKFCKPTQFPNGADGWNLEKAPINISLEMSYQLFQQLFSNYNLELDYDEKYTSYITSLHQNELMKVLNIIPKIVFTTTLWIKTFNAVKSIYNYTKTKEKLDVIFNYPILIKWSNKNNSLQITGELCVPFNVSKM
tara:strand:+ start:1625 stop:3001 length:1377 start_codon:yes stop_codon:yes gene_type:complete